MRVRFHSSDWMGQVFSPLVKLLSFEVSYKGPLSGWPLEHSAGGISLACGFCLPGMLL